MCTTCVLFLRRGVAASVSFAPIGAAERPILNSSIQHTDQRADESKNVSPETTGKQIIYIHNNAITMNGSIQFKMEN